MKWSTAFILSSFPFLFVGTAINNDWGMGLWADALLLVLIGIGCKFYEVKQEDKAEETYEAI